MQYLYLTLTVDRPDTEAADVRREEAGWSLPSAGHHDTTVVVGGADEASEDDAPRVVVIRMS